MVQSKDSQPPKLMLKSTKDALLIIEAAERGLFPRLVRRLTEQERAQNIYSGAIFVYDEFESNIGDLPIRELLLYCLLIAFLPFKKLGLEPFAHHRQLFGRVYREMKKHEPRPTSRAGAALPPQPASARSLTRSRTDTNLEQSAIKRRRSNYTLVVSPITRGLDRWPCQKGAFPYAFGTSEFTSLTISQELLRDKSAYRVPPRIELENGLLVYAWVFVHFLSPEVPNLSYSGEGEKQNPVDSEKVPPESGIEEQDSPIHDLPPLRKPPSTRVWDPMPIVDSLVYYDGPAYTCQARTTAVQYEFSQFNTPASVQDQTPLLSPSIIQSTLNPSSSRSTLRLRDGRQNPYPGNQDRPLAKNLNVARSLRETEFNRTRSPFSPTPNIEYELLAPSPEYLGCSNWPIPPSNVDRSGGSTNQCYAYPGSTNDGSIRLGNTETTSNHLGSLSRDPKLGPQERRLTTRHDSTFSLMDERYQRWVDLSNEDISPDIIRDVLFPLEDELWVAAACADRILSDVEAQTALLELGLLRTSQASEKIQTAVDELVNSGEDTDPEEQPNEDDRSGRDSKHTRPTESDLLKRALNEDETSRKLLCLRAVLLRRLDLTRTYGELLASRSLNPLDGNEQVEDDDPWAEEKPPSVSSGPPFLSLFDFLTTDIVHLALLCASTQRFSALKTLFIHHLRDLFPFRLHVLESIPAHASPIEYVDLLPTCNFAIAQEETRLSHPWREDLDWVEQHHVRAALADTGVEDFPQFETITVERPSNPQPELLSGAELTVWFKRRIEAIDTLGLIDIALTFVQHAASLAIPDLDEEGEELTLLARLVYDAPISEDKPLAAADDWNLSRWRSMDPPAVIRAYLTQSTPETVAADIRRLVVPYLFVLDARKQRKHAAAPVQVEQGLSDELLYGWILNASLISLPLSIFECLPAWETSESGENNADADEADTTLASLAAFVTPTTAKPRTAPADLYTFFKPLSARALSRALDILDVHLESGEVLSRWGVPAPLRWFVQSAGDATLQRSWAIKMARRSGAEGGEVLLDDMIKLSGGALGDLRGAFGALKKDEVVKIFFEGLLSSGRFDMAHDMLNPRGIPPPLPTDVVENLCLRVSREFYDNATSGNIHSGDMKLAYECLNVPLPTPVVIKEREFIEATSRICAFNVVSRPGVPITPLEIRLVKDRLSLVGRVLSSTEDAYKHTQVILDLVAKLGFRGDLAAEVKALAMIADAALSSEDFEVAAEVSIRWLRPLSNYVRPDTAAAREATEVCWHTCYQLGRQTEFTDTKAKMTLLAHVLELCPPENVNDVLAAWKRLEAEKLEAFKTREPATKSSRRTRTGNDLLAIPDLSAPLISPDAAAAAARTFSRVAGAAANFPFSVRGRLGYGGGGDRDNESVVSGMSTRSRSPESTVSNSARHALSRGVGWLIGAGE
ncbi:Secretory pathway protein Sec39 [Rhizoctonia solani]|uniref:Secretory pathway protein Sec39 n=1 Tax=Rhizoctonia solani TaxID=456999 RepID=A0A8H7IJG1_9AGAM|nr:Secretory pathway protein Sec39 [Rhizoctonia solani]